jgi:hypothetical protein
MAQLQGQYFCKNLKLRYILDLVLTVTSVWAPLPQICRTKTASFTSCMFYSIANDCFTILSIAKAPSLCPQSPFTFYYHPLLFFKSLFHFIFIFCYSSIYFCHASIDFFFHLSHINDIWRFHYDNSTRVHTAYLEQVHLHHYMPIPPFSSPSFKVFGGFHFLVHLPLIDSFYN